MMNSKKQTAEFDGSIAAAILSALSALLSGILFWWSRKEVVIETYDKGLLAALLATAVVAGSRALEGPGPEPGNRSRTAVSNAVQLSRSWLLCFVAIASVFILTEVIAVSKPKATGSGDTEAISVSGTLKIETPTKTQNVLVVGRTGT